MATGGLNRWWHWNRDVKDARVEVPVESASQAPGIACGGPKVSLKGRRNGSGWKGAEVNKRGGVASEVGESKE